MSGPARRLLRIIVNGKNADDPGLRRAVEEAARQGHRVEVRVTREPGDGARFAADRQETPIDVLVAAGGDGTVNEVLNGMLTGEARRQSALAIVPLGTANDFARSCDIPPDDPVGALQLAWEDEARLVDVGQVNGRFFLNVATAGFGADVAARTPSTAKRVLGGAAYGVTGLVTAMDVKHYPSRVILPGEQWEGNAVQITVGNGRQAGGGFPVAPKAALDDGLLDLLVIHDAGLPQAPQVFRELRDVEERDNEYLFYRQVPSCRLEFTEEVRLNVDGEPIFHRIFEFRTLPRHIKLVLPPGTPLSGQ